MRQKRRYAKGPASVMAVLAPALCAPGMVIAAEPAAEIVARHDAGDAAVTPTSSPRTKSGKPLRFRAETLRARGLPEDLAEFFAAGPRFLPGTQLVYVSVNGASPKRLEARFDSAGQLCLNAALLTQLGLRVPAEQTGEGCREFLDAFPETRIKPRPSAVRVDLVVPEEAIDPAAFGNAYLRGGAAAMLNYNVSAYQSRSKTSSVNSAYGQLQPGVNLGNWVLRSSESYYKGDKHSSFTHQQAYAGRTIEPLKSMFQVGQLQSVGQGFGGLPMIGAQLFSDSALNSAAQLNTPIQGVAHTRALVEVRQRGQLIYQTVVAPGAFSLDNIGRITLGADLEVEVIEEDGRREKFVIAAATGFNNPNQDTSFSISAGRYRNLGDDFSGGDGFVTGDFAYSPLSTLRLSHSALLSKSYQGFGTQASFAPLESLVINGGAQVMHSDRGTGTEMDVNASWRVNNELSLNVSALKRNGNFLFASDALSGQKNDFFLSNIANSVGAGAFFSIPKFGNLSYSYSQNTTFSGDRSQGHNLAYSRAIGTANLTLGWQTNLSGSYTYQGELRTYNRDMAYLNVSVPFANGRLTANTYQYDNSSLYMAKYTGKASKNVSYSLGATKYDHDTRFDASIAANTSAAQLGAGLSVGDDRYSARVSATGSWILSGDTFAATSNRVGDTFGLVKVPGVSGLRITTTGSSAITNSAGVAVIPHVRPYQKTRIEVDGRTVPKNYRLQTTATDISQAYGSVSHTEIAASETRQLLLNIQTKDGQPVTRGTSVRDEQGNLLSTVVGKGNVMLLNDDIGKELYLQRSDKQRCKVAYDVPEKFDRERSYEEASAMCEWGDVG